MKQELIAVLHQSKRRKEILDMISQVIHTLLIGRMSHKISLPSDFSNAGLLESQPLQLETGPGITKSWRHYGTRRATQAKATPV